MQPPGTSAPSGKVSVLNYAPDRSGPRFVRRSLVFYLTLFAGLWIVAIGATYLKLHAQGKPFRANAMIFEGGILRFSDFADFDPVTERFTLDGVKGQVYPAPMVCIYLAFTRNFTKPLHKYLLFVASGFLFVAVALAVALYRSRSNRILLATAALLTLLVGYPFIYLLERANAEGIIFLVHAAAASCAPVEGTGSSL